MRGSVKLTMPEAVMTSRPRLGTHARLQWDHVREKQVLLTPEGVLVLNVTASAILALCDGRRTVSAIVDELSASYNHPVAQEVLTLLNRLARRSVMEFDDD